MIVVYGFLMVGYLVLLWKAKKQKTTISSIVYGFIGDASSKAKKRKAIKQLHAVLYNERRVHELADTSTVQIIQKVLLIVIGGTILSVILWIMENSGSKFIEDYHVDRNPKQGGSYYMDTTAYIGEESYEIPIEVAQEQYTKEELETLYATYLVELEKVMIGTNQTSKKITTDLNFPINLPEYPFVNEWSCSDYLVVDSRGVLHQEELGSGGKKVSVFAKISCHDFEKEQEFPVTIYPKELEEHEQVIADLKEAISKRQKVTEDKEYMELPSIYDDHIVLWEKTKEHKNGYILLFSVVIAILLYLQNQKKQSELLQKRTEQMLFDYATIVNQLTLYLGAGMTLRKCFQKMVQDYTNAKKPEFRYAYEELKNLCQELESGVSENMAYENLGRRCDNRTYLKFTSMLSQNIRKGSADLLNSLKREVVVAGEEHKAAVRVKAEQATTKLLIPMVMMLSVVMIMIMVPAFMSFQL